MGIIYKVINKVNGKCYIGQSIRNEIPKHRHIENAVNNKKYILSNAIRKYGLKNFIWEVLCKCESKKELNEMECYYIKECCSYMFKNGHNMTWGGEGGDTFSYKSKEEKKEINKKRSKSISERQIGVPRTEKAKKALSKAQKKLWQNRDYRENQIESLKRFAKMKKNLDPEYYSKLSRTGLEDGKYRKSREKKYVVIFPDGGEKVIQGINRFCREHNLSAGDLGMVVRGKRKSHKGYKARYYEE